MENTSVLQAERVETLVGTYGNMLFRFCLITLGNTGDAEDAVQETFIRFVRKQPSFRDHEHEKAWLLKVAGNQCRDILRRRSRHPSADIDEVVVPAAEEPHKSAVLDALMTLPEKYRTVLLLYYVEEYDTRKIAKLIGRTPSAVKMRLKKGRELLTEAYRKETE